MPICALSGTRSTACLCLHEWGSVCCQGAEMALTWDATVARAAPRQPQSAVKMSRGASTTLMPLQARVPHRGVLVSPRPLYTPCGRNRQVSVCHMQPLQLFFTCAPMPTDF